MLIASWNVNSISVRLPHLLSFLEQWKVDHLGLQELKCTDDKFPYSQLSEIGYSSHVKGEKTYNGVALLSRNNSEQSCELFADVLPGAPDPQQSRLIAVHLPDCDLNILNLYVPNGSAVGSEKYEYKLKWFEALLSFVETSYRRDARLIIMGDFNIAPTDLDVHDPELWKDQVLVSQRERDCFSRLLDLNLVDSFRALNPEAGLFSWWDYRQMAFRRNHGLRIDHILVSRPLMPLVKKVWIEKAPRKLEKPSDHAPVVIEIDL